MAPITGADSLPRESQILLFGDLSLIQFEEPLRRLLHVKTNALLTSFFDRVNYSLRRLIEILPIKQQNLFPHFTTLIDLLSRLGETPGTAVLRFCLLSVHEVAQFIEYYGDGSRSYPSPSNTYVIGPCTGGFAAAAISCSQNLPDVIPNGVEAVTAAFRTALRSYLIGDGLSRAQSTQSKSWSAALSAQGDLDIEGMLNEYAKTKTPLRDSTLWLSATTPGKATTLSGRPSVLQDFVSTNSNRLKSRFLDIHSPYHAARLFDADDVEQIVGKIHHQSRTRQIPRIPLLSSSTGEVVEAPDFPSLLRIVIEEALREPIRWEAVLSSCRTLLAETRTKSCTILPFSSNAASMVSTTLAKDTNIHIDVEDLSSQATHKIPSAPTGRFEHSRIAIVGYSGRFPSAESNEKFWELLKAGRDVHREIPADRFDWKAHWDPTGKKKNTSRVKYGCFIDEPGLFDPRFFNMSPREAENTDPAQRLAITTTYEAMEMAGMVRNRTPSTQQDRIGVFFGTTSDDWREVNSGQDVGTYFIPGGNRAFVPGRISYFFRFSGPSLSIDTACSSSFAAIQAACSYLWKGDCDTAVAGGTNVLTNPDNFAGLDRAHFLSTTGNCNAFDDGANGYCRSDAVGSVILKRLEDAEADNDPIFGVIVGTNTNHCGQTDSITRPHEGDQSSVFKRIIRHSDIDPLDVSYIEMHGTGTQAGDATEMNSVMSVFVPEYKRTTERPARPLYIGSAKANIGHAESASGVSSLIKVLMMMKHSEIPPHCGIKTKINHNYPLDLAQRGINIAFETTPWQRKDKKRAAFLNNFSAAGGNTAILVEDAPERRSKQIGASTTEKDSRSVHIVAVTAKTSKSLTGNINSLIAYLEKNPSTSLGALSYTTTARRMHHNYRVFVSGSDATSISSALKSRALESETTPIKPISNAPKKSPRVVFVFTGQGTLYAELGRLLFDTNAAFRSRIHQLNRLAQSQGFPGFLGLIDGSVANLQVVGAVVSQLVHVCIQIALSELWKSWGVEPAAVIGHSLGEYAALYAAGVLSVADTIYLVGTRAVLLEKRCTAGTHAMLAIKGSQEAVLEMIHKSSEGETDRKKNCELACANQPTGHVVAGPVDKISKVARAAADVNIETVRLDVPFAFHSAQVEPILSEFEQAAAQGVVYHPPTVPVLSPLLAKLVPVGDSTTLNASYLTAACRNMVDFKGAVSAAVLADDALAAADRTIWLEIGPHPACSGMVKGTLGSHSKTVPTLRKQVDAYKTLATALEMLYLSGIELDWNEYHRDFPTAQEVLDLPMYAWDSNTYWIQYRNDFCLTKGDDMMPLALEAPVPERKPVGKYISPCAQQVVEEFHGAEESSLIVESDIFDEKLLPVLAGHLVNGARLCPSSMYADLVLTMAKYMVLESPNKLPIATTGLEVFNVRIDNPLIARTTETTHRFRASATVEWHTNVISFSIFSVDGSGKRTASHAKLDVRITPEQHWSDEWKRNTHLITSRIEALAESKESHTIKRGMAYKIFGALVEYGSEYQGMAEVVMDSKRLEAYSTVQFQVGQQGFLVNPKWIDSVGGVAGFIMNANDAVDSRTQVFINHGWERMRIAEPLEEGKTYRAYNRMQLVEKTTYAGDTYILEGDRIVAIFEGVTFQGVPRRALDHLLPGKTSPASARPVPPSQPAPQVQAKAAAPKPKSHVSAPALQPKTKTAETSSGVLGRILALIGEEIGVTQSELKPEVDFMELGIDSLLSLTITGKIREELGLEFPTSLFIDHPTVGDLRALIGGGGDGLVVSGSSSSSDDESEETQLTSASGEQDPQVQDDSSSRTRAALILRQIISEETRVGIDELTASTSLVDIGVDSLLSLTITGKLQELLNVDIPSSTFMECDSLQEIEDAVCKELGLPKVTAKKPEPAKSHPATSNTLANCNGPNPQIRSSQQSSQSQDTADSSLPQASSILLSGSPQTARLIVFLFPDGSGSASSYAALAPAIDTSSIAVYGLNCPWRKSGAEMTRLGLTMSTMVSRYVAEVRRLVQQTTKARGKAIPVAVGGWSAGGILAVEAIRQLQQHQDGDQMIKVSQLLLFDSPNPIGLQNPPQRMYDFFDTLGIFGGGGGDKAKSKTPEWLRQHFDAFLRILDDYEPTPLPDAPASLIVYAKDGVCKDPNGPKMETRPDDPREMLWLLNNRTDFSAEGWASVLGRGKLNVKVLEEVNHFTLMDPGPKMKEAGHIVTKFLS
ncbi:polyketide synthase [Viridothelium virens]|uniref:Polyketide synthase n=1 Tax=Viridothelium virens TaxID=1048519 RepID=A0A6A6GXN0_VIRVR|nr:polyketide synthase [Viridothelium virens]